MKSNLWLVLTFALSTRLVAQDMANPPAATPAPTKTSEPLPKAALDKIAAMTPIFDGQTLNGWIQSPLIYNLAGGDVSDINAFAKKISEKSDAVSAFLNEQLDETAKGALAELSSATTNAKAATSALMKGINKLVTGPSIYEQKRFAGVQLSPGTEELLKSKDAQAAHLNRLLLEDAYPAEIAKSKTTSWVVKDGAMASTGAGRGVIYTKEDYTNYRIVFEMRQISGNPGHQPCVLFFCTRPAAGEKGLDALGGIQFQVPNGGHWDYRPGFNKGGEGFKNPIKTKFNNREWSQVEILVNAKNGTARMAVAQPLGTKGIENLVYTNAEAGKTGPFALQMHNGGLFDEYKNVRVEVDPKGDRLITGE